MSTSSALADLMVERLFSALRALRPDPLLIKQNHHVQRVQGMAPVTPLKSNRSFTRHPKNTSPVRTGIVALHLVTLQGTQHHVWPG